MKRCTLLPLLTASFFTVFTAMTGTAQDAKKDAEKKPEVKKDVEKKTGEKKEAETPTGPPAKPADWTKFPKYDLPTPIVGELVKITETSLTLRNQVPQRQGNRTTMKNVDVEYTWHANGLARREKPPKFFDVKGLERPGKPEELDKLKKPIGTPGYHIDRSELKTGDIIRLELVRPSTVPASKVKPEDLTIKYAIMAGEHPKPTTPIQDPKK